METEKMKILSRSQLGLVFQGCSVIVGGEFLVNGKFVVYRKASVCWEDGKKVEDSLKESIFEEILRQAIAQGGRDLIEFD